MQIVSIGDNLHEMSKPDFWENREKYYKMSSAENFTQSAEHSSADQIVENNFTPEICCGQSGVLTPYSSINM